MVVAELGTTYDGEGGIYDWVRDGLGDNGAPASRITTGSTTRLWIASLATMFPDILGMVFGVEFNLIAKMGIDLAFVWIVYLMGRSKAADSEWVLNGGAIIKVAVAVIVGALGIWYAMENGLRTTCPLPPSCPSSPTPTLSVTCRSSSLTSWLRGHLHHDR